MKSTFFSLLLILLCTNSWAQKDTTVLSGESAKEFIRGMKIDTTKFLNTASLSACKCIDSISLIDKNSDQLSQEISRCIDKQAGAYMLAKKVYHSMVDTGKNINIIVNNNKKSTEYVGCYFQIEAWLKDSCKSLNKAVASNNKESEYSLSKNEEAINLYIKGNGFFENENYKEALTYFEKAVKKDPKFAFAWDNIDICNRRLNNFDAAIEAYNKSLALDPKGKTPLQNIPVAYEYKKDYDKALQAYFNILTYYPDDPEAYYGAGRIYAFFKIDFEKSLQYMCKCYNIYTNTKSPYRVDAEKQISYLYGKMKTDGKEDLFYKILEDNNIKPSKN
jgi:tetratricopeptide (TPR) repeat protein